MSPLISWTNPFNKILPRVGVDPLFSLMIVIYFAQQATSWIEFLHNYKPFRGYLGF